jgi:peptide/nickel transport system permease protein
MFGKKRSDPNKPLDLSLDVKGDNKSKAIDGKVTLSKNQIKIDNLKKAIRPRLNEARTSMRLIRRNPLAVAGLILIVFIMSIAILAPVLAPPTDRDPYVIPRDPGQPMPPGANGHPFGTGKLGADIYYGVVWGARISIWISLYVVLTAALIGIVVGAMSGYIGGKFDELMMRITDVFLSIPALILSMAIVAVLSRNLDNIVLSLVFVWWPSYARLVRGQVLSIKENTYVEAARAVGVKKNRILFRHIIPNSMAPMIVSITMDLGSVVLVAAALSYIGFGVPSGYAEWGKMVSDGQEFFLSKVPWEGQLINPWWMVTFPGMFILLFVMGFALFGDALRDILDPRARR